MDDTSGCACWDPVIDDDFSETTIEIQSSNIFAVLGHKRLSVCDIERIDDVAKDRTVTLLNSGHASTQRRNNGAVRGSILDEVYLTRVGHYRPKVSALFREPQRWW
jgi:hypothetical protein